MKSPHHALTAALPGRLLLTRSLLAPSCGKPPPALCWQRDPECPQPRCEAPGLSPILWPRTGGHHVWLLSAGRALHKGIRSPHGSAQHQAVSQLWAVRCLRFSSQICGARSTELCRYAKQSEVPSDLWLRKHCTSQLQSCLFFPGI